MTDQNCIFCKLSNGEIPTRTIYEDELFRVILDADPATKGHALILPKGHYKDIYELPETEASEIFVLAKKMATHMTNVLKCDGFNIVQNNGEVAGQTVFHFHLHLIPRFQGDGNEEKISWNHAKFTEEELDQIRETLKTE